MSSNLDSSLLSNRSTHSGRDDQVFSDFERIVAHTELSFPSGIVSVYAVTRQQRLWQEISIALCGVLAAEDIEEKAEPKDTSQRSHHQ